MSSINQSVFNATNHLLPNIEDPNTVLFKVHVTSRVYHLLAIPVEIITRLVDAILGVGGLIGMLFTFGKFQNINQFAFMHLDSAQMLVPSAIKHTLSFINPSTKMGEIENPNEEETLLQLGITTLGLIAIMTQPLDYCRNSSNPFLKHVLCRLLALVTAVGIVAAKVVDIALGCIASALSLITLGTWTKCNNFVFQQFKMIPSLTTIALAFTVFINPVIPTKDVFLEESAVNP